MYLPGKANRLESHSRQLVQWCDACPLHMQYTTSDPRLLEIRQRRIPCKKADPSQPGTHQLHTRDTSAKSATPMQMHRQTRCAPPQLRHLPRRTNARSRSRIQRPPPHTCSGTLQHTTSPTIKHHLRAWQPQTDPQDTSRTQPIASFSTCCPRRTSQLGKLRSSPHRSSAGSDLPCKHHMQ